MALDLQNEMPPAFFAPDPEEEERKRRLAAPTMPAAPVGVSAYDPSSRGYKIGEGATNHPTMPAAPVGPMPNVADSAPKLQSAPMMPPAAIGGPAAQPAKPIAPTMPPAPTSAPTAAPSSPNSMPPATVGPLEKRYEDLAATQRPELHGWKKVLDVIGQIHPLGRMIEQNIPGNPHHYDAQLNQAAVQAAREQSGQGTKLVQQGEEQKLQQEPVEAALRQKNIESEISQRGQKDQEALAKIGMKRDEQGAIVPDENSTIYQGQQQKQRLAEATQKNLETYRQSQIALNEAKTAVENAKNDPNSPAYKQAQQKLAMAQEAHAVAAQNLGLHQAEFANKLNEQELVKPSGQAQSRASAAQAVLDVMPELKGMVNKHRADMGPIMGRINRGELAIGNVDPEIARLYGAMKSFYALQPAVHGFRNAEFVKDFEHAIGTLERNPDAFIAGMEGLKPTMESVAKEGKTFHKRIVEKTTPAETSTAPKAGGIKIIRDANGRISGIE